MATDELGLKRIRRQASLLLHLGLRSGEVLLVQLGVLAFEIDFLPVDKHALDVGFYFERVAIGEDEVG
jgi:hypothetical protein